MNVSPVAATANISVGSTPTVATSGGILVDTNSRDVFAVVGQPGHPNQVTDFAAVSGGVVVGGSAVAGFYTEFASSTGEGSGLNADVPPPGSSASAAPKRIPPCDSTPPPVVWSTVTATTWIRSSSSPPNPCKPERFCHTERGANNIAIVCEVGGSYLTAGAAALQCPSPDDVNIFQYNTLGALVIDTGLRSSGNAGYAQAGPGTVELNGDASGGITLPIALNGGLTVIGNFAQGGALGTSATTAGAVVLSGGNLDADFYTGTIDDPTAGAPARAITVNASGGSVSATTGNTLTIDGAISGAGVLGIGYGPIATNEANNSTGTITQNLTPNTAGKGVVILSGTNTAFTGGIAVNAGTLRLDTASAGTGLITVNNSGQLAGNAQLEYSTSPALYNNVTVKSGGQLTPGDPISLGPTVGTLGVGSLNLNSGSISNFAFASTSSYSQVDVNGNLVLANGAQLNIDSSGSTNPYIITGTYDLFVVSGSVSLGTPVFGSNAATYTLGTAPDGADTFVTLHIQGVTPETWANTGGGSWNDRASWYPTGIPNSTGAIADFLPDAGNTANVANGGTVTLDGNETVGTLYLDNSNSFTIASGTPSTSTLHILASGSAPAPLRTISEHIPLALPSRLTAPANTVTVTNSTNTLIFDGAISGTGARNCQSHGRWNCSLRSK